MNEFVPVAITLATGAVGAFLFYVIGAPAAFLTGSAIAITIAVAAGLPTAMPNGLRQPAFAILGVMMGAGVQPDSLAALTKVPVALVGLALTVAGATFASYYVMRRFGRWDRVTALCGSIPGALQVTLAVAFDSGARMERVVIAQAQRLIILVVLVPVLFGGSDAPAVRAISPPGGTLWDVLFSVAIAIGSAVVGNWLRIPSATMVAPLCVAAVLSGSGLVTFDVPWWLSGAAFIVLGGSVATRFSGVKRAEVLPILTLSLGAFAAAFMVTLVIAIGFSALVDESIGTLFVSYSPGGADAMIALAFLLHYDVAFVAVLHVTRLIFLSVTAPVVLARLVRRNPTRDNYGPETG